MAVTAVQVRAFSVHVLTASGAAFALLALLAAARGAWAWMFVLLGAAHIVDAVDGVLARRLGVAEKLPRWSGDMLDLVIDFTTYVFVPAFAITTSGLLPPVADVAVGCAIVVSAAIYCGDRKMKLPGNYFRGFPVLWNTAAFYLFLLQPRPWIGVLGLMALVVLTFVPFPFVHPIRVRRLRWLNLLLLGIGMVLALIAILNDLAPGTFVVTGLCLIGIYFFLIGLLPAHKRASSDQSRGA